MVTMSARVFWLQVFVAFSVAHSLSVAQAEKSGTASNSFGNKNLQGRLPS